MIRTQVQLTAEQAARLKEMSARQGVSIATLVRQAVDGITARSGVRSRDGLYRGAARPIGRFRCGRHAIAARHDAYLPEDFAR